MTYQSKVIQGVARARPRPSLRDVPARLRRIGSLRRCRGSAPALVARSSRCPAPRCRPRRRCRRFRPPALVARPTAGSTWPKNRGLLGLTWPSLCSPAPKMTMLARSWRCPGSARPSLRDLPCSGVDLADVAALLRFGPGPHCAACACTPYTDHPAGVVGGSSPALVARSCSAPAKNRSCRALPGLVPGPRCGESWARGDPDP